MEDDCFSKFDSEFLEVEMKEPSEEVEDPFDHVHAAKRPRLGGFQGDVAIKEPFQDHDVPLSNPFISEVDICYSSEETDKETEKEIDSGDESDSDISTGLGDISFEEPFVLDTFDVWDDTVEDTEELYPSSKLTVIKSLALLFSWFCSSPGTSKAAFGRLLHILNAYILPGGNSLPVSYKKALSAIKHLVVPVQKQECCVNDCVIYRKCLSGDFSQLSQCPKCNEPRYEHESKIPRKVFKYIPLGPRLSRMYRNESISRDLQSHLTSSDVSASISDIHQSQAWKARYDVTGPFQGDARCISLSLCADGMNPFSKEKVQYSMWPIVLTVLNLPRKIRNLPGSVLLSGIIPGREEPKNLDPYFDILVDEIIHMNGSNFFDGYRKEHFVLKIDVLLHVFDYPGHNKVFHCQGAGAYAGCAYCTHIGEHSKALQKIIYPGNRCFLPDDDPLRNDCNSFPQKEKDKRRPPDLKTTQYVEVANDKYDRELDSTEKSTIAQKTGCKGAYSLGRLPLHERIFSTPIDPMHLVKNIAEHCVYLISGIQDSFKVREEEKSRNRFCSSWIKDGNVKKLPPAPFALSKDDILLANARAQSVQVHSSIDWRPRAIFGKRAGMKAHEWMEVVRKGILKFCVRGMLGRNQRRTLFKLFDVIDNICMEDVTMDTINELELEVHHTLALFERDFPVTLQVIVFHLLHHLPSYVKHFGPVYGFWMYPYERFNSWISRRVLNRRYPESTVIETYRLSEWASFMEVSKQLEQGATGVYSATLSDEESDDNKHDYFLTDEVLADLRCYYVSSMPEYEQLLKLYEQEKRCAKSSHHLRKFPSFSEWQPTASDQSAREMQKGPSSIATRLKHSSRKDPHGRVVKFSTMESDQDCLSHRSSYISSNIDGVLAFGRILMIFYHTFLSNTTAFAYVSWFEESVKDKDTNMSYVQTGVQTQSIIPVSELSNPLVVAFDEEESGKLWILGE